MAILLSLSRSAAINLHEIVVDRDALGDQLGLEGRAAQNEGGRAGRLARDKARGGQALVKKSRRVTWM